MFRVQNEFSNANLARSIRFTEKLFNQLNEIAAQKNISFNLVVLQCCKYALDNMDHEEFQTQEAPTKKKE